jgi:hypothetical protein
MEWFLLKLRILACMNKIWREPFATKNCDEGKSSPSNPVTNKM